MTHRAALNAWILGHADDLVETLAALVCIPSVVGDEAAAQAFMRAQYARLGLEIEEFEPSRDALSRHPAFVDSGIPFDGRRNVVATLRGAGGGRALILNGHSDVVSPEPASAWRHDPFGAQIAAWPGTTRGVMYGRGAMDMKSGLIANLFAVAALKACSVPLAGDVILESVIEEEAGGAGTLACFERGIGLRGADGARSAGFISTEPHWEDICIAHPGILYFRIVVEGRSAHAGRAHLGVNAAVELAPIIAMLGDWDRERAAALHYEPFERLDPAARRSCHLNVGVVRAGDWPSTVPGRAELEARMSFIPGETESGVKAELARRVAAVAESRPWLREHPPRVQYFGWHAEPWMQDEQDPFVQSFVQLLRDEAARGRPVGARPMGITAGLDTRFAGLYGVPAFAWGPRGQGLHGADEHVDLDTVVETARVLALFATGWCGGSNRP